MLMHPAIQPAATLDEDRSPRAYGRHLIEAFHSIGYTVTAAEYADHVPLDIISGLPRTDLTGWSVTVTVHHKWAVVLRYTCTDSAHTSLSLLVNGTHVPTEVNPLWPCQHQANAYALLAEAKGGIRPR